MDINKLQVYAPTADKEEPIIEEFYEQLNSLFKLTKSDEITIIIGDFNAKIGEGKEEDLVGEYGLGLRNNRGHRLIKFFK